MTEVANFECVLVWCSRDINGHQAVGYSVPMGADESAAIEPIKDHFAARLK